MFNYILITNMSRSIVRVALQEHKEYNKQPIFVSSTTQHYKICDKTYFIYVHLLVLLHKFKYSLMRRHGKY